MSASCSAQGFISEIPWTGASAMILPICFNPVNKYWLTNEPIRHSKLIGIVELSTVAFALMPWPIVKFR